MVIMEVEAMVEVATTTPKAVVVGMMGMEGTEEMQLTTLQVVKVATEAIEAPARIVVQQVLLFHPCPYLRHRKGTIMTTAALGNSACFSYFAAASRGWWARWRWR
jgi:hypothetical protein